MTQALLKAPKLGPSAGAPTRRPSAWSRSTFWSGRHQMQGLYSIGRWLSAAGSIWTMLLMALIVTDVLGRSLLNAPLPRVPEIVGYSIVAIVFLQVVDSVLSRRLARSDAWSESIAKRRPFLAAAMMAGFQMVGAVVMGIIAIATLPDLVESWRYADYFGSQSDLAIQVWPFRAVVVICAGLASVAFLVDMFRTMADAPMARANTRKMLRLAAMAGVAVTGLTIALLSFQSGFGIAVTLVVCMVLLVLLGMPIAMALAGLSFVGVWLLREDFLTAADMLKIAATGSIQNQLYGVVPLFVLMGLVVNEARIARDAFDVCEWLLGKIVGGLGIATVAANTVFAAITGISIASAVVFTRVAVPPMLDHGYSGRFAVGIVAGSSVLGMLIPPSLLLIVYGIVAEVSVGALFTASIIPGIILAAGFALMIYAIARFAPSFAGVTAHAARKSYPSAWSRAPEAKETPRTALAKLSPIGLLIVAVLGGIYGGVFTPTEAGAVGAALALCIYAVRAVRIPGLSNWPALWRLLIETGQVSVSILLLIIAANMYTRMIALSGLPADLVQLVVAVEMPFAVLILCYLGALLLMGMVLDSVSIMLITLPLMLPILASFDVDLIWFGILTVIAIEVGLLTPPLGLSVFVVKAALGNSAITLRDIFIGTSPFVGVMLLMIGLLFVFPQLTSVFQ
ncbi:TRAP transporter large permease subunit [uncultured Tateyamaria sp.]|uniref:TRAP transporter large permease subunit n=1 Tax=uncultured Tateyamaria sp. TaxID=455651 RepID=UPI002625C161|nr:TRAP transporter large permease subunit [uncultured Tateyamaria sp.]